MMDQQKTTTVPVEFTSAAYGPALIQLGSSLALYGVSIYTMFLVLPISYGLTLLVSLVATAAYIRLFMIGHDCSHRSFMPTRAGNILVGNTIGVLTNTPLYYWGFQHSKHHRNTGNLDRRGAGDVTTFTVEEFHEAGSLEKVWYRIGRNPWVLMFIFGPIHFLFMQRLPLELKAVPPKIWRSVLGTNLGIACYYGLMIWIFGLVPFLLVYAPVVLMSSTIAVWFFYVQHSFDDTYWEREEDWQYEESTLKGSSFYDLPRWLHWVSCNIGYHHIHHLNPRVPNYRLAECYESDPAFQMAKRIRFWESFRLANLALWDEAEKRLISFREYREKYS